MFERGTGARVVSEIPFSSLGMPGGPISQTRLVSGLSLGLVIKLSFIHLLPFFHVLVLCF